MSERKKTHNGRDLSGRLRVKQADVEDLETDLDGVEFIKDDVRLDGAVADTGPHAGQRGERIGELIEKDRGKRKQKNARTIRSGSNVVNSGSSGRPMAPFWSGGRARHQSMSPTPGQLMKSCLGSLVT